MTEQEHPGIEKAQIQLDVSDSSAVRAQKSWLILGGQGPVNPVFEKIFEAYWNLDRQKWEEENTKEDVVKEAPALMAG